MKEETLFLVVHDRDLYRQLQGMKLAGRYVVTACGPTMGRRAKAVVFVDQPTPEQVESSAWRNAYRAWVATALLTRLTPDGVVVGLPGAAASDHTEACQNAFV